jgi:hypothetical protein
MSMFERLLVPGSTERPTCRCGEVMEVASIERLSEGSDAAIRVYRCTTCSHEMRLTVWATVSPPATSRVSKLPTVIDVPKSG